MRSMYRLDYDFVVSDRVIHRDDRVTRTISIGSLGLNSWSFFAIMIHSRAMCMNLNEGLDVVWLDLGLIC